jgi:membrane associated rhomboid family serine protease
MANDELKAERDKVINGMVFPALFVGILWLIYFAQYIFDIPSEYFGCYPHDLHHLYGIFTFHLVHGGFGHIYSNSIPLFILGSIIFYFYRGIAFNVFFWVYINTGVWLWAAGRSGSIHIGASGLVYGFVAFLFFSGIFRWDRRLFVLSILVTFLYGGLIWGVLPLQPGISWEGHLMGALAGLITAWFFRKEGPKKAVYVWEDEEDETDHRQFHEKPSTVRKRHWGTGGNYRN